MNEVTRELPIIGELSIEHERDLFFCRLIRELTGTLQDVVGLEESSGSVSVVGQRIGDQCNEAYKSAMGVKTLARRQISDVLVDLKARIHGEFYVIEQDDEKIVLGNRACPFGELVADRPSLCMMTSNVFGVIAAENLGYAKVVIEQAIARGDQQCHVIVHLKPTSASAAAKGREYFKSSTSDSL